jgi:DNA-binding MarR family transcriptional regulator
MPKKAGKTITATEPPQEELIQVRIFRINEVINQLARYSVRTRGLRTTDMRIMNLVFDAGELSINELARRSHVDKAWISRSVMELLKKRLVGKKADPNDARAQLIRLTPKSRTLIETVRPQLISNERRLLADIGEQQLKQQLDKLLLNADLLLESYQHQHKKHQHKKQQHKKR